MRIGQNPNKNSKINEQESYLHQVILPVWIPNGEGYFKDGFKILKICIQSLLKTTHKKTFITIVNNGSCDEVVDYLNSIYSSGKIHEIIHTTNIGKINAVVKGYKGHKFKLITVADADVLFLSGWQSETYKVFNSFKNAGVVGLVPQIKLYSYLCSNIIFDFLLSKKLRFTEVENPEAMRKFYKSIGWQDNYNQDFLASHLTLHDGKGYNSVVGSGHFVATYKQQVLNTAPSHFANSKMGKQLRYFFDSNVLKKGGYRLTTKNNYAYHMGNVYEPWMDQELQKLTAEKEIQDYNFSVLKTTWLSHVLKNQLFRKLFQQKWIEHLFLRFKGLPKEVVKNYNRFDG